MATNPKAIIDLMLNDASFRKDVEKAFNKANKDADKVKKSFAGLGPALDKTKSSLSSLNKNGLGGLLKSVFNVKTALIGLVGAFSVKKFIDAAAQQETAVNNVAIAMKRSGEFSRDALADMEAFASKLQDVTGVGDETSLAMISLAKGFGASNDQAKLLTEAAIELSAVTGKSTTESIRQLSKTLGGFAGELGEVDPQIKALTREQLRAGKAAEVLLSKYGGTAAAQMSTFAGAMRNLSGRLGDLQEPLGDIIIKNPAVVATINALAEAVKDLTQFIHDNREEMSEFVSKGIKNLTGGLEEALHATQSIVDLFKYDFLDTSGTVEAEKDVNLLAEAIRSVAIAINQAVLGWAKLAKGLVTFAPPLRLLLELTGKQKDAVKLFDQTIQNAEKSFADYAAKSVGAFDGPKSGLDKAAESAAELKKKLEELPKNVVSEVEVKFTGRDSAPQEPARFAGPPNPDDLPSRKDPNEDLYPAGLKEAREAAESFNKANAGKLDGTIFSGFKRDYDKLLNETRGDSPLNAALLERTLGQIVGKDGGLAAAQGLSGMIAGGKSGAQQLVSTLATGLTDAILPGLGQALGPLFDLAAQGPEVARAQIEEFAKALPDVIDGFIEAIPVIIETLAEHSGEIITAIIAATPKIVVALAKSMPVVARELAIQVTQGIAYQFSKFGSGVDGFANSIHQAGVNFSDYFKTELPAKIKEGFAEFGKQAADSFKGVVDTIKQPFIDFVSGLQQLGSGFHQVYQNIVNFFADLNPFASGSSGGFIGQTFNRWGLATGGQVVGPGTRDTVPAMLTPGELVIDRTTGPRLMRFIDEQSRGESNESTNALLRQILSALGQPIDVQTSVQVHNKTFADIMLQINRASARVA